MTVVPRIAWSVIITALVFGGARGEASGAAAPPEAPRAFVDTTFQAPGGRTTAVRAGGDLQAALTAAQPGDLIELEAGASWRGNYRLPNKTTGSGWITVRSSAYAQLPPPGARVGPEHAPLMPKIVALGSAYALSTEAAAHHYRFVGIEITGEALPSAAASNALIVLDGASSAWSARQTTLDQVPHHLVFERCYVHAGPEGGGDFVRGFVWNSAWTALIDSYVAGFKSRTLDTQAVVGWNGPGPFKLVNNYLEAAGENVMFGGAPASIPNLVPSDIEIRRNDFKKLRRWYPRDPDYAGIPWLAKNHLEFKNGQRVLVEGNIFEDHWAGGQSGWFLMLSPRVESGANPWAVASDVMFRSNWVRRTTAGIAVSGHDAPASSYVTSARVAVVNNVFEDLGLYVVPGAHNGVFLMPANGIRDLTVEHNTIFNTYTPIFFTGLTDGRMTGFVFRNNILHGGGYGIVGDGAGGGVAALDAYAPGWIVERNVIAGPWPNGVGLTPKMLPSGNLFPDSFDEIGFVNRGGGDYRLAARSRYRNAATGGGAPGADVTDSSLRGMPRARAPQGSFSRRPVDTVRFERLERDEEDAAAAPAEAVRAAAALGPPVPPGARARPRGRRPWRSARFAERL